MNNKKISNVKVLMYHRVLENKPAEDKNWQYVTVDSFKKQMKTIIKLGYIPVTFYDYKLYLNDELTLPKKPVIITFDDGYLDTFEIALPILQGMNMTAVIFAMGNRELKRSYWDQNGNDSGSLLGSDQHLRIASRKGFEIGSHSMNHIDLSTMTTDDVYQEIMDSKKSIENVIDRPIHTFAYPYGCVNERISRIVKKTGFSFACGVFTGPPRLEDNMFDIRRITINQNVGLLKFILYLTTPYQYLNWLYSVVSHSDNLVSEKVSSELKKINGKKHLQVK